ncbi:hypothetical protein G9A89_022423 [Geosiphon pyriformis]|nr:hypothetical protein G9A89_022423 [Geosiphon pyriformis]
MNTESARETFYRELIQNTNLPINHNFASIITEINKEIEHHTQQRYPITYASKDKGKLQTPAVTPRKIQPPIWKKNRIESPSNPSYHYISGSAINISSTDAFPSTTTLAFGQFSFQSRQRKTELLGLYKAAESEKEEEESEDQEFTYQHPITENPEQNLNLENSKIETLNHQRQNNPNPELINQQNLPLPLQLPPQQPVQQQLLQQPPQPLNLDPMAYVPIAKLDNFTGKENDTQVWLNNIEKAITANKWNDAQTIQSLVNKPQDFNAFKVEFLRYFSNNNSINCLINTFTIIKQGETEVILNQFIHGLCSSILQHVCPLHLGTLQDAVTCTRDFEFTESEANHTQAVNLVMNGSSELDSKLEKFSESINKRLEGYLADNYAIYHGNRKCVSAIIVVNKDIFKLTVFQTPNQYPNQNQSAYLPVMQSSVYQSPVYQAPIYQPQPQVIYQQLQPQIIYQPQQIQTPPQSLPPNGTQRPRMTQQSWRSAIVVHQLISSSLQQPSELHQQNSGAGQPQNLNSQNYLSLLVTPEDASTNNPAFAQKQPLTSNISPATITENEFLAAIFSFEFEKTTATPLFSGATLEAKPITVMYTDTKVEGQFIKLILDSSSAGNIITRQLMDQLDYQVDRAANARIITANGATKTPISEIDNFPFEVNGIVTSIKVLVMEATQYQALVGNDWLSKVNATLDWNTQELQEKLLIELEEEKEKPTWKAYQVSWADADHNKLPSILFNWVEKKTPIEATWRRAVQQLNSCPHDDDELWQMAITKIEGALLEEIRTIKNNSPEPIELDWDAKPVINFLEPKDDFEYDNDCDLIYNPPPHMIYTISKEEEPISSCASESESLINRNPDSDDNDENTGIMPEYAHDTDAEFDLRYPGKEAIKLEPQSCTCIDLKVALEIPATTMVQLASRSSLAKREINIRGGIIDAGYIGNIIAMLQNNSEKAYIIEPNKKIAQAIFLPLVRIAQLVLVGKRGELGITTRGIQGFGSMDRIDVPVNMAEEEIVDQREIISTGQAISISPYNQYMLAIERKEKDQAQIFKQKPVFVNQKKLDLSIFTYQPKITATSKFPSITIQKMS